MRSLPFLMREALVNLRRHGIMTAAAITTIGVALALLGGFLIDGLLGGALAAACVLAVGRYTGRLVQDSLPSLVPYGAAVEWQRFALALIAFGALIGAMGSLVS